LQIAKIFHPIAGASWRLMTLQIDIDAAIATGFARHTPTTTGLAINGFSWSRTL
jgi:hypothetical protein